MEWLDLVVPSAAILALFGVVALVYVAIRQGRTIRRLEQRLAERGEASVEAPLQRIAELPPSSRTNRYQSPPIASTSASAARATMPAVRSWVV